MQNTVSDALISAPGLSGNSETAIRSTNDLNRTVLGRLLWKDWRVVRQVVVAITVIMPMLQAFFVLLACLNPIPENGILGSTVLVAMLAPTFIALGCSGMLIGHERQTGTWGWSSVLPTSWRSALLSKLIVTLSACLVVFCMSAIIPSVLFASGQLPFVGFRSELALIPLVIFLVWFEIIAFFYLALLLFREPLVALIVGAIAVSIAQLIVIGALTNASTDLLMRTGLVASRETAEIVLMFSLGTLFFFAGTACMVWAFRWRWTYGQSTPLAAWTQRLRSKRVKAIEYRVRKNSSPSEWGSQIVLSFRQSLAVRLICLVGLGLTAAWLKSYELNLLLSGLAFQIIGIIGATTFAGDQSSGRFRFFADRGVSPRKLVTTRLTAAMTFAVAAYFIYESRMNYGDEWINSFPRSVLSPPVAFLAFSIGAFGSLCFRRPIIAVTVTVLVLTACWAFHHSFMITNMNPPIASRTPSQGIMYKLYTVFMAGSACFFIAAVYRIAYRWVVQDRVNLGFRYVASFPIAAVVMILVLIHFGFFLQPSYDPKNYPLSALHQDVLNIPGTGDGKELFEEIDTWKWLSATNPRYGIVIDGSADPHSDAYALNLQRLKEKEVNGEKWLEQVRIDLGTLDYRIRSVSTSSINLDQRATQWNLLLAKLAVLGRVTASKQEVELSTKAWQYAKNLLDTNSVSISARTQEGRAMVWWSLSMLTDNEIVNLGGPKVVRELCPKLDSSVVHFRNAYYLNSIHILSELDGKLASNEFLNSRLEKRVVPWYFSYLPVKWFVMRTVVADYRYLTSPASGVGSIRFPAADYQDRAREFLERLDRLQAAADQSDQSDRTDL